MGRASSMHAGEKEYVQGFYGKVKKKRPLGRRRRRRIILR
jgi:hypothetical protein